MVAMQGKLHSIPTGGSTLRLPAFFPSVSSVKTNMTPFEYAQVLSALGQPRFLVSAYDVAHSVGSSRDAFYELLEAARSKGAQVLLDSGNYEKYWHHDRNWTAGSYHEVLTSCPHDLAFCYDNQEPASDPEVIARDVERSVLKDSQFAGNQAAPLPIIHGSPATLPAAVRRVAELTHCLMLAVPERELGNGLLQRVATVSSIRQALDGLAWYCPLHLLGTGNPVSILAYTLGGADSFDGLEWCQTAVNTDTALLYHFHQWDVYGGTHEDISGGLPYHLAVLTSNLTFFNRWMDQVRAAAASGTLRELLGQYLPTWGRARAELLGMLQ